MAELDEFEYDNIVASSVLQEELQNARNAGDQELVDKLEMASMLLSTNAEAGILTPEEYERQVNEKIKEYEGCIAQGHRYAGKMQRHVELMKTEIEEMKAAPEEEDPSPASPSPASPNPASPNPASPNPASANPVSTGSINVHDQLMTTNAMYRYCYGQLAELKQAFEYLRRYGLVERMGVVLEKAEIYQRVINEFRAGKVPSMPLVSLSPKDLFGLLESERLARLDELILAVRKLASHYKSKALEALRTKDTEEAQRLKAKMQLNEKHALDLESMKENPWLPLPKVSAQQVTERVRACNEDVPENVLRITVEKVSGVADTDAVYVTGVLTLQNSESRFQTPSVKKAASKGINYVHTVTLDPAQLQSLDRRRFTVELFTLQGVSLGSQAIKTTPLEEKCTCPFTIPLTRSGTPSVKVIFAVRQALKQAEYVTLTTQQLTIVNYLPPFKHADGRLYDISAQAPPSNPVPSPQEEVKSAPVTQAPQGISPEELKDPNILTNLNAHSVLEEENKRLMEMIPRMRAEGKDVSDLIPRQREVSRKFITLQQQVSNGLIQPSEYKSVLESSVQHDQLLFQALRDRKENSKASMVAKRIEMMQTELRELGSV